MPDARDHVELTSRQGVGGERKGTGRGGLTGRPWLGLFFRCAGVYGRAYRNEAGTAYIGRCPRCGKPVYIKVGAGGTSERMFEVRC